MNWYKFSETSLGGQEFGENVFKLYPNPTSQEVTVTIPETAGDKKTISLKSANGIVVKNLILSDSEPTKTIFVGDLPKGFYIMELKTNSRIFREKLIIQ